MHRGRRTEPTIHPEINNLKNGVEQRLRDRVSWDRAMSVLAGIILCAPTIGDMVHSTQAQDLQVAQTVGKLVMTEQ